MQFEKLPKDSEFDSKIAFDSEEEAEIIRAVYREQIVESAKRGNTSSVSSHHRFMSDYGLDGEYPLVAFKSTVRVISRLQRFYERTDEAVIDIANSNEVPPYDNFYIQDRMTLGESALELAGKIGEEALMDNHAQAVRELPETEPERNIEP
jgi:hypothetical protein